MAAQHVLRVPSSLMCFSARQCRWHDARWQRICLSGWIAISVLLFVSRAGMLHPPQLPATLALRTPRRVLEDVGQSSGKVQPAEQGLRLFGTNDGSDDDGYDDDPAAPPVVAGASSKQTPAGKQVCAGYVLGIGAPKCGTTSLWGYLSKGEFHPQLIASPFIVTKELSWFMHNNPDLGLYDYNRALSVGLDQPLSSSPYRLEWRQLLELQKQYTHAVCPAPNGRALRDEPSPKGFRWDAKSNSFVANSSDKLLAKLLPLYMADITPEYLYDPRVPVRVKAMIPEARMLVLLRNPVARTVSEWSMTWGIEDCRLGASMHGISKEEEAERWAQMLHERVAQGIKSYQDCYQRTLQKSLLLQAHFQACLGLDNPYSKRYLQNALPTPCGSGISLIAHSVYVDQLERWLQLFPSSQFLIWLSEEFKDHPRDHLTQMSDWLGLNRNQSNAPPVGNEERRNIGDYASVPSRETMQLLQDFFAPHNERLFKLLEVAGFGKEAARMRRLWSVPQNHNETPQVAPT